MGEREDKAMKINSREFTIKCYRGCGAEITITVYDEGYVTFESNGVALHNVMTDGSSTVDFFCSQECKDGE